jgi:hypothetical protein
MSTSRISPRLQKILHSLATRVPKIVLQRAEDIFPSLHTSLVSDEVLWCFCQSTVCFICQAEVLYMNSPCSEEFLRHNDCEITCRPRQAVGELQKALLASFEAFLTSFLYLR